MIANTLRRLSFLGIRPFFLGAACVLALLACPGAVTATIYVDATSGSDTLHGGTAWDDAFKTIQHAVDAAAASEEVWVRADTYLLTAQINVNKAVRIYGGFPAGNPGWADRDPVANATIVNGQNLVKHCFFVTVGSTIDGFGIGGGNANGTGDDGNGGGIFVQGGTSTIQYCGIAYNHADVWGGGILAIGVHHILNCLITENTAWSGGGLCLAGDCIMTDCSVSNNTATEHGGGIYSSAVSPTITRCTITGNITSPAPGTGSGGGAFLEGSGNPTPRLINCIIRDNNAVKFGGGIFSNASAEITRCDIRSNTAQAVGATTQGGGGIYLFKRPGNDMNMTKIVNCIIANNVSAAGGGIDVEEKASPEVINCSIVANQSTGGYGGGMCVTATGAYPVIMNTVFSGSQGGQLLAWDSTHICMWYCSLSECLGWMNNPPQTSDNWAWFEYFIDYDGPDGDHSTGGDSNYHLQPFSELIDRGTASHSFGSTTYYAPADDFDGVPRPQRSGYDIGAYENALDSDYDGVSDLVDNCPGLNNPGQEDDDGDGVGNACDVCAGTPPGAEVDEEGCGCLTQDYRPPEIFDCRDDIQAGTDDGQCNAVVSWREPYASDNCAVASFTSTHHPGDTFPLGSTVVTYTATDFAGNTTTCTFEVTVVDDDPPTFGCPADQYASAQFGACAGYVQVPWPTDVQDNCGVATVTNSRSGEEDPSGIYMVGVTTITWTVTDIHGNTATCATLVYVTDDQRPTITTCPQDRSLPSGAGGQGVVPDLTGEVVATDNCGIPMIDQDPPAGSAIPVGDTIVTMTASEGSNSRSCQVKLTVVDATAPTIVTCAPDRAVQAGDDCQAVIPDLTGDVTATDNADAAPTITQNPPAGTVVGIGVTTVTITVADDAGNSQTCTARVSVAGGTCDQDQDGIASVIEDGAPNGGDGNNDGVRDSEQLHVASLLDINGNYVAIEAPAGSRLAAVSVGGPPSPNDIPEGAQFPIGFVDFDVLDLAPGAAVQVRLFLNLPAGVQLDNYWKYGPTPDDPAPHWYSFMFDGTTGAEINGNLVILHFVDGQRGDGDLTANGILTDPGAPAVGGTDPAQQSQPAAQSTPCVNWPLSFLFRFPVCGFGCLTAVSATLAGLMGMKLGRRCGRRRARRDLHV